MRRAIAAAVMTFMCLVASRASAQKSAEELFVEAGDAFESGNLGLAQQLLSESLALSPQSATALNLGRVHQKRGDPTQALEICESLLAQKYGVLSAERTAAVTELKAEARKQVGHAHIRVLSPFQSINLDGRDFLPSKEELKLPVNPGAHVLLARCPPKNALCGGDVSKTFDVRAGEVVKLVLKASKTVATSQPSKTKLSGGFFKTAWPWVIGTVLIAGGVALALWATGTFKSRPDSDPQGIYPTVMAHTARW